MTPQICCNCDKEFEGVMIKKMKERRVNAFLKGMVFKLEIANELLFEYIYDALKACEHCNNVQLIKEKEDE